MSKTSVQAAKTAVRAPAPPTGLLQRKCDCGNHTVAGGECEECGKEKEHSQKKAAADSRIVQAKRAHHDGGDARQRDFSAVRVSPPQSIADGGGHQIEMPLRRFMEARFDRDFSGVRLHTDERAAASAQGLGALAYTAGEDIVFAQGSYEPETPRGLHLLAHELTHVVQQSQHPGSRMREELEPEPETSPAEVEADRMAESVLTPGSAVSTPRAQSTGLNRGIGWAIFGGIVGGLVGGLLGALGGPVGAILGAVAGAAVGAWIGGSSSASKKDNKQGTARARIHRLLSRNFFDWVITDEEALQALGILQEVDKKNPEELFEIVMMMKLSGEWRLLRDELPGAMRMSLDYFDQVACNPDHGYIMPGDTIHLEFLSPGESRAAAGEKDKPTRPASYEASLSHDYDVGAKGIELRDIGEVAIVGKTLKQAADLVAEAYTDPLKKMYFEISVDLTPVRRGIQYSAMGQVSSPETAHGGAVTPNKASARATGQTGEIRGPGAVDASHAGGRIEMAVNLYYREVEKNLDKYDDPEALWKWAQEEADKRFEELNKKTPAQEFLEFGQHMIAQVSTMPPTEQGRIRETYSRYIAWLSKHDKDPKLASYNPVDIWAKAYVNIIKEEVAESIQKARDAAAQKKYDEEFKKAEVKFGEAIEFAKKRIWPTTPTEGIELHEEQISETTGEPVTVGYLIMASPAEKIIRDKIASDFLHSVLDQIQKDPEAFNKLSIEDHYAIYLSNNPEQARALELTTSHPYVERQEHKVDIPAWQTAAEVVVGFIPIVGNVVAIGEALSGRDLFNHPLTTTERVIVGVGVLLPEIAKLGKLSKEAFVASKVVRAYGLEGAEAARVYRMYMGLLPGSSRRQALLRRIRGVEGGQGG